MFLGWSITLPTLQLWTKSLKPVVQCGSRQAGHEVLSDRLFECEIFSHGLLLGVSGNDKCYCSKQLCANGSTVESILSTERKLLHFVALLLYCGNRDNQSVPQHGI